MYSEGSYCVRYKDRNQFDEINRILIQHGFLRRQDISTNPIRYIENLPVGGGGKYFITVDVKPKLFGRTTYDRVLHWDLPIKDFYEFTSEMENKSFLDI